MSSPFNPADPATALAGAALLLPPVAILAPRGIAPLAGVTAAWLLLLYLIRLRPWAAMDRLTLAAIAIFAGWGCMTALWSLLPDRSVSSSLVAAVICVGGLLLFAAAQELDAAQRARVGRMLGWGSACGALLLIGIFASTLWLNRLFESVPADASVTSLNRAASIVAILCWPLALIAGRRWPPAAGIAGILLLTAIVLPLFQPAVPVIAFIAGGLVFAIALWSARAAVSAVIAGMLAIALLAPAAPTFGPRIDAALTANGFNENSLSHRLGIWGFSSARAMERPLTGWGFATARAIPGGQDNLLIMGEPHDDAPSIPLHPHNGTIQIWLETGAPALLLVLLVVARAVWAIPRRCTERRDAAALLAMCTAIIAIANMSYGIWQGWWLSAIWLCMALGLAVIRPQPRA